MGWACQGPQLYLVSGTFSLVTLPPCALGDLLLGLWVACQVLGTLALVTSPRLWLQLLTPQAGCWLS